VLNLFLEAFYDLFLGKMIPPNASLVKYDNPALVSRNTDKKSPRVSFILAMKFPYGSVLNVAEASLLQ
jgi:hypothetical protein